MDAVFGNARNIIFTLAETSANPSRRSSQGVSNALRRLATFCGTMPKCSHRNSLLEV